MAATVAITVTVTPAPGQRYVRADFLDRTHDYGAEARRRMVGLAVSEP